MNPALITAIVSGVLALGSIAGAIVAYGRSSRMAESQVISVTVEAAEGVVKLVTSQLERSVADYNKLSGRVDALEKQLEDAQGRNVTLQLQVGKLRKRVKDLEDFIHDKGWTPPPHSDS